MTEFGQSNMGRIKQKINSIKQWFAYEPGSSEVPASIWIDAVFNNSNIQVVQIGSNDGKSKDPLFDLITKNTKWQALFVEPVPYLFEKLKANYGDHNRFIFEKVAINDGSRQSFYSVKEEAKSHIPDLPVWYDQLNSFDKENILKHLDGILEPYIEEMEIEGITLQQLLNRNKITKIDLLHIDTEGYDWKILSQLDLKKYLPTVILYEHRHISNNEKQASLSFLKRKYRIFNIGGDFICLRKNVVNKDVIQKINTGPS